jgi:hypothetical protein
MTIKKIILFLMFKNMQLKNPCNWVAPELKYKYTDIIELYPYDILLKKPPCGWLLWRLGESNS